MTILRGGIATARWIGSIMHCTSNAARRRSERQPLLFIILNRLFFFYFSGAAHGLPNGRGKDWDKPLVALEFLEPAQTNQTWF
jgi:hypothetical protein